MKTDISRSYEHGFFLSEQELRRIIQASTEHAEKASKGSGYILLITVVLRDGSIIETSCVDDIFIIENAGAKRITKVQLKFSSLLGVNDGEKWKIEIAFEDGGFHRKNWDSISLGISGNSRDWSFVTASDLEDRIKRTKIIAWDPFFSSKWVSLIAMVVFLFSFTFLFPSLIPRDSHLLLQKQYESGKLRDPIQALIYLESIRNKSNHTMSLAVVFFAPLILVSSVYIFTKLLPLIRPSYNFYWGDYIALFDKRRQTRNVVWTVCILGLLVSVAATIITKKLGF